MPIISAMLLLALWPYAGVNLATAATLGALALVAGYIYYYRFKFKYFAKRGMRNPPPWPFVGNLLQAIGKRRFETEREWPRKYGKFYGFFQGSKPLFVVADADLLRQICIKDFEVFPNHEVSELMNKCQRLVLFFSQDDRWKRLRALQSPTFTSGKIKRMYRLLQRCALDLADCFEEQLQLAQPAGSAVINLKDIYGLYTMDAIATCGYGLKLGRQSAGAAAPDAARPPSAARDEFVLLLAMLGFVVVPMADGFDPLLHKLAVIIESRRKQALGGAKKFHDYLQLLLDAKLDAKLDSLDELDVHENHHAGLTLGSLRADQAKMIRDVEAAGHSARPASSLATARGAARLSDEDILASALALLAVGLETTSTLLAHCTYALAHHSDVQARLHGELMSIVNLNSDWQALGEFQFDYEALTSCAYLDAVISETLRLLSPVLQLDRVAKRDYHVEKYDVTIPRNSKLLLAFHAIMNDPDHWERPERFDPERFMPENRHKIAPGSYCPFGIGPRHCIGMRFSLTESKLALATVLLRYQFEPAPQTRFPPLARRGFSLCTIDTPQVIVKARRAEKNH